MRPSRPATAAAVRFLRSGIRRGVFRAGDRLPTISLLAEQAGVGRISMARGVAALADEGILDVRRKRGIVLTRGRPEPIPVARAPSKSEEMSRDIVRRLLGGTFGPSHVLPSIKELQECYGAGFRGVKKVIESLRRDGIIVPHGRGYRLRGPAPGPRPKTLVLIIGRDMNENLGHSYARTFLYPLLYALERDCRQRNVRLEVQRPPWRMQALVAKRGTLAHFVLLDDAPDTQTIHLITHLATLGAPVLVFRDGPDAALAALPRGRKLVYFECNHPTAGRNVGSYLLALGHRRIAYLRRSPPERWSVGRLAGLRQALEAPAVRGDVTVIDLDLNAPAGRRPRAEPNAMTEWEAKVLSLATRPEITAWVPSDDQLAISQILPLLRRRRMALGRDVSIVSFNDQMEAFDVGLTSYNFNSPGVAAAVLSHAILPGVLRRPRADTHPVVEVEGYIVDRGSVRPV